MAKPFIKWAGGKNYLLKYINELLVNKKLPSAYCEPMVGGGAVFFNLKDEFTSHLISDSNIELINLYKVIKQDVDALILELKNPVYTYKHKTDFTTKTNYYDIRNSRPTSDIKQAARILYLLKTCFNGLMRVNKGGGFNVPMGSYTNPKVLDEELLKEANLALQDVDIRLSNVHDILCSLKHDYFLFVDPPYHGDNKFTGYSGGFGDDDQKQLIDDIGASNHKFIYANRATDFIIDNIKAYHIKYALIPLKHSIQPKYTTGKIEEEIIAYRL